jgi:hypothetical protein
VLSDEKRRLLFGSSDENSAESANDDDFETPPPRKKKKLAQKAQPTKRASRKLEPRTTSEGSLKKPTRLPRPSPKKRKKSLDEPEGAIPSVKIVQDLVEVPRPQEFHDSWQDWLVYLEEYTRKTHQHLKVDETRRVSSRIADIKRLASWQMGHRQELPPLEFDFFHRTYSCIHGGTRRASKGRGVRPQRRIRDAQCPFRFVVQVVQLGDGGPWKLQVRLGVFCHRPSYIHSLPRRARYFNP